MNNQSKTESAALFLRALLVCCLVGSTAALILLPSSPLFQLVPGRDSGVYLYSARRILEGGIPYLNLWHHKGPIQSLLNVLGLALHLPSWWGVWLLRVLFLSISLKTGFTVLKNTFGAAAAWFSTLIWLCFFTAFLGDGNLTEEYALTFGFSSLWLFFKVPSAERPPWTFGLLGVAFSAVFLLRQNLVGTLGILTLIMVIPDRAKCNRITIRSRIVPFLIGTSALPTVVLSWLASNGALRAWWECTWIYNRVYIGNTLPGNVVTTLNIIAHYPFLSVCWFLMLLGMASAYLDVKADSMHSRSRELLWFAILAWPVEFIGTSLSGLGYDHYFLSWLVPGAVLIAHLFSHLDAATISPGRRRARQILIFSPLVISVAWLTGPVWLHGFDFSECARQRLTMSNYLVEHTDPNDTVMIWGAESGILFRAQRRSPEPYFFSYPLLKTGYESFRHLDQFMLSLMKQPPIMIIDTSATNPVVPPIAPDPSGARTPTDPSYAAQGLEPLASFVLSNYRPIILIGPGPSWIVYKYQNEGLR